MSDPLTRALAALPHGRDFRFLDRLVALDPGRSGRGEYTVRGDEPFLRGHFPGDPMMPGVLFLEVVAQFAGVVAQVDPGLASLVGFKLMALCGVKVLGTARPGETIGLEAEVVGRMGHLVQAKGSATIGARVVLQAELTLSGEAAR